MKALTVFLLVATGAVWGLAMFLPRPPAPLDEEYRGKYEIFRYENLQGAPQRIPDGQERSLTFNEDGTYLLRVLLANQQEMERKEGLVKVDEGDALLTLRQLSQNRVKAEVTEAFRIHWGEEKEHGGRFLRLTSQENGYRLFLRRVPD